MRTASGSAVLKGFAAGATVPVAVLVEMRRRRECRSRCETGSRGGTHRLCRSRCRGRRQLLSRDRLEAGAAHRLGVRAIDRRRRGRVARIGLVDILLVDDGALIVGG
ncbi:hypothetical protein ACVOMV_13080 [Mesorhizobium atlanticum]